MKLLTNAQCERLLANGRAQRTALDAGNDALDLHPVVNFFTPDAQATWLLTGLDARGLAFGLCDRGFGEPEVGYVHLNVLDSIRGKLGLPVERDLHFEADRPISEYATPARDRRWIVT